MESPDVPCNKRTHLDDLSKDELIKKYNNLLVIAKKAKQAKDESCDELKKYKENEMKLSSDVAALKEVVESFNKKQNEFAEVQNKHKLSEEKNFELKKDFEKLEEKYALKIAECSKLQETLVNLSDKISALEIQNFEYKEKLNDFKENYAKIDIKSKIDQEKYQKNEVELTKKLHIAEDKYLKLEMTLKEFQGKYLEECKNHEELQETLSRLQNKSSSGRCSSRSSDSLKPVYENQEYDEILDKYSELAEKNKLHVLEIEKLNTKLYECDKEWSEKYGALSAKYVQVPENWNDIVVEHEKLYKDYVEGNKLKELIKAKEIVCLKCLGEVNEDILEKSKEINIDKLCEKGEQHVELLRGCSECRRNLQSSRYGSEQKNLGVIHENSVGDIELKISKTEERAEENSRLMEKAATLEKSSCDLKIQLEDVSLKRDELLKEVENVKMLLLEKNQKLEESLAIIKEKEQALNKINDIVKDEVLEKEILSQRLKENEKYLVELKKHYDSAIMEKEKLIEICQSDNSTEEIFKKNISQLKEELMVLRQENDIADKRYREMELKVEESRAISELLKREIDGKCDEYDAFKKEMEFYKLANDELKNKIKEQENEYIDIKRKCDDLNELVREKNHMIEYLLNELNSSTELLRNADGILCESVNVNKGCYTFETMLKTDEENHSDILKSYVKDKATIDTLKLVADLKQAKLELKKFKADRLYGVDNSTETEESGYNNRKSLANCHRDRFSVIYGAVSEIKYAKTKLNEEFEECFSVLRSDYAKLSNDVTRKINDVLFNLQTGNAELLTEMNDMNQALKERGEVISKLEKMNVSQKKDILEACSKISQLESKLSEKKKMLQKLMEESEAMKCSLDHKEKTVRELEEEVWKLRNGDSLGETLSSSTCSKVEEAARLMDVEESFEERYSKLKTIAAKLKKKVSEQQKQLDEERSKAKSKSDEFQAKINSFQCQIKSLLNLQCEYDRLREIYEDEKKDKCALRKMLESANEKVDSLEHEVDELKMEKDKFLNAQSSFESIKKKLSAQIITLKACVEEEKSKVIKLEKELEKSEYERTLNEKKFAEEKEKHKGTVSLLEKQKLETKNLGVLKLEIAEYEKSVNELGKKLSAREETVKDMNELLENQRDQCKLYLDEIARLKSKLTQENERVTEVNLQMEKYNQECNSRNVEFKEKINEIGILKAAVEDKKKEMEEMSLELAKIGQEKLKVEEKCKNIEDHYTREIHSLQGTVGNLQDALGQRNLELNELRKEFDAYKVRAQSVLRQSQKEMNQSKQRNVLEELEQLRSTSESLKARLEESGVKMQKLVEENEVFQEEKNRLYTRIQELKNSLSEVRAENQELKQSRQEEMENHNEMFKLHKIQSETLAHCYQNKIDELEMSYKVKIDELTKSCEQTQKQLQKFLSNINDRRDQAEYRRNQSGFIPVKCDKEILDVMLLEREECEGSESVESVSPQTGNNLNLIPLEQLLNSPDNQEQDEKRLPTQDVNQLSEKLEKSENRIKHLTALLSDAETDCAKLQHLNHVLKEEIRRNQRNVEREKHAQNFEYMKNVILKFVSLQNVDEKKRLVPVLTTILKLSPEEENLLANVAKGLVEHSNQNRGWGSYLNIWHSGQ